MVTPLRAWPGRPYPLGATWDGSGVNFALFSEHATGVELCLFDPADAGREIARIPIRERTDQIWHVYLPEAGPGQLYGYRVHGPWAPVAGHRFNPAKLVLDPYAKAIAGTVTWSDPLLGQRSGPGGEVLPDDRDDAGDIPKCVVIDPSFPWGDDHLLGTPWNQTVIYEVHVKGFTARHPGVPPDLRGTYAGLICPPVLDHLRALGVTAVELMPVHQAVSERALVERGLTNYWGYNSIAFLAPDARYCSSGVRGQQVREFKTLVKTLHHAGVEVILDVVYNHTAEGDHQGPTLCFRGIDNAAYYRLRPDDPSRYVDYTGCGNALNMTHPRTLQLIMDSLRYWVLEMHVDGFRFDLAATLARELHDVDRLASFFDVIHQDPVISQVKLIAEPWDLAAGGYQVGNFPIGWAEWNGRYRDAVRRYWRGEGGQLAELAYRLTGSSDLYQDDGRSPYASINFVTAHDGFTLADLVSYNHKHNEANGEGNRDGTDENHSWNGGVEGPTDDPTILAMREGRMRSFLAMLFLSQGVPMLTGGDEIGRTQRGNNNAYCQDNEVSWCDWNLDDRARRLLEFTRRLIRLRRRHPELRRRKFFQGRPLCAAGMKDLAWLRPDGGEMADAEWRAVALPAFGFRLCGEAMDEVDERGEPITGDTLLVLMNAHDLPVPFTLPDPHPGLDWEVLIDSSEAGTGGRAGQGAKLTVPPKALVLLRAARA
ncbi:MAG TPA: glycogen debranching protein GlgX [Methylomirabilota bacterium]|nr:glycogen debranching protein GlgX [Methylomirabilota bacterium]